MQVRAAMGDITTMQVDAIVNAANERLQRGGGVCGAIFRAAGPRLDEACDAIGRCQTGDAVATPGFDLPARWIIHAVGPVWKGGRSGEAEQLASFYRRVIEVADEVDARSVAIPAISTGIYGYPSDQAAALVTETLAGVMSPTVEEVVLVAFDQETARRYERLIGHGS